MIKRLTYICILDKEFMWMGKYMNISNSDQSHKSSKEYKIQTWENAEAPEVGPRWSKHLFFNYHTSHESANGVIRSQY